LLEDEPAWTRFCGLLDAFLGRTHAQAAVEATIDSQALVELTGRERKVLALVAAGLSNVEIGAKLFISEKTVRNHLTRIFDKLGVNSRARAIVLARDAGLH
jgi:DNA-binding CsgD family transcriptional regulator